MSERDAPDPKFDEMTARLLRREALRRAAKGLDTTSGPGLEEALARISAEVTTEAGYQKAAANGESRTWRYGYPAWPKAVRNGLRSHGA